MKPIILLSFFLLFTSYTGLSRPTGRLNLKVAVMNYEPIFEKQGNAPYWKACGWTDPRTIMPMIIEGWREATDNMVQMEVVYWKDLDVFPFLGRTNKFGQRRYTDKTYWKDYKSGWKGTIDAKLGNEGYMMIITNDFPEIIGMVERGEIDHCIMFGGPYFGYWETHMIGKGAYYCNSGPTSFTNERLFVINGMNVERPGTGLHNYGHGLGESGLGSWFFNSILGYDNKKTHLTNVNDFVLYTRCAKFTGKSGQPVNCGNTHFAPNSTSDYSYNMTSPVICEADQWYSFPFLTNAPRLMTNADWAFGRKFKGEIAADDETFQKWWWNHIPRYVGLRRGHINNWLSYVLNPWKASYPVGSGCQVTQKNIDLRGWFSYQIYAPPGTTQITVNVTSGAPVYFGLRKGFVPYGYRGSTKSGDEWTTNKVIAFTKTLDVKNNYGKGLPGYWYLSFGGSGEKWKSLNVYESVVNIKVLPKPTSKNVKINVANPVKCNSNNKEKQSAYNISWNVDGLPQGVRATYIFYRLKDKQKWIPICADYDYQMKSPYKWFIPNNVSSTNVYIKIVVEDVYGKIYTGFSNSLELK